MLRKRVLPRGGKARRQIPGALACGMGREARLGEDDCFILGHAVFGVLSCNQVEMPYGCMSCFDGRFPVQMEGKAMGRTICQACCHGGFCCLGAIGASEPWGSANSGGKKKEPKFFAIQQSIREVSTFLPEKQALNPASAALSVRNANRKAEALLAGSPVLCQVRVASHRLFFLATIGTLWRHNCFHTASVKTP